MYATRPATKQERQAMQRSIPSPLGHTVTGYDAEFHAVIETQSETRAATMPSVSFLRRRQPNGKFIYRAIVERPTPSTPIEDHRTTDDNETRIKTAIAQFPKTFALRAHPGKTFRISPSYSYISQGEVMLYTEVLLDGQWLSFAKGTVKEMQAEVVR